MIKDWAAVIDLLYPPINPLVFSSTESEVFRQWSAHEAFAMARRQVFVRTPRIREMLEVLSLHAEVEQGIRRKTSMVVPAGVLGTFMTSLPGCDKEMLPPVLVIAGMCVQKMYWAGLPKKKTSRALRPFVIRCSGSNGLWLELLWYHLGYYARKIPDDRR